MYTVVPGSQILQEVDASSHVVDAIASCATERGDSFHQKYLAPILTVAEWVQHLPCARDFYSEPFGGVRFAATAGFVSLRLSEGVIYTPSTQSEHRHTLERQFKYATYLAVIFSAMTYPMWLTRVISEDGEVWHGNEPLSAWAKAPYQFEWSGEKEVNAKVGAFRASRAIPIELLGDFPQQVMNELLNALSPSAHPIGQESVMQKTVRNALLKTIDQERKRNANRYEAGQGAITHDIASEIPSQTGAQPAATVNPAPAQESQPPTAITSATPANKPQGVELLAPEFREIFELVRDDIKKGGKARQKIKMLEGGVAIPMFVLSEYGIPDVKVEAELRKKSLLIQKEGRTLVLDLSIGKYLLDGIEMEGALL